MIKKSLIHKTSVMKKTYQHPMLCIISIYAEQPIAASNIIEDNDAIINPETMEEGDGSDAVKSNPYSLW